MRSLRPLVSRSTYRGWAWLILGGALLMPYMMAGEVVRIATFGSPEPFSMLAIEPAVFAAVLPAIALTALALPVRALSVLTARSLLGADVPDVAGARGWSRRWRDAAWFTVHLGVGGVLSGVTLALVPFLVLVALLPFVRDPQTASGELLSVGWPLWLGPLGAPLALAALVYAVWATTRATRWCAPKLLGPSAAEQLAASRAEATRLAARNRIARELHDSVGHALSVVTVQAAAAGRVLDSDPEFARKALGAVEETARRALDDLDQVLGVLRADAGDAAPRHGLEDLPS
ncbi:MAG: sensor histidine kinase, partial [Stackebrandtia sp.]